MNIRRRAILIILSGMILMIAIGGSLVYQFLATNQEKDYQDRYLTVSNLVSEQIVEAERITNIVMYNGLSSIKSKFDKNKIDPITLKALAEEANFTHLFVINRNGDFIASSNESPKEIPNLYTFSESYRNLFTDKEIKYLSSPIIPPYPEVLPFKFMTIAVNDDLLIEAGLRIDFIGSIIDKTTKIDSEIKSIRIITPDGIDLGDMKASLSNYNRKTLSNINTSSNGVLASDSKIMTIGHKISFNTENCAQCGSEDKHFYYFEMEVSKDKLRALISELRLKMGVGIVLSILLSVGVAFYSSKRLVSGVEALTQEIKEIEKNRSYSTDLSFYKEREINELSRSFNTLKDEIVRQKSMTVELEKQAVMSTVASQVSHDIKSPLSALTMIAGSLDGLTEESRLLIRNAVQRISDIANDLASRSKEVASSLVVKAPVPEAGEKVLLSVLVEQILSEKRIQHHDKPGLVIQSDLKNSTAFVSIDRTELLRLLSNLINNAIEALPNNKGSVTVAIREFRNTVQLSIKDDGRGIPDELLAKLGTENITHGKQGSGLGFVHAKRTLEASGASISILSREKLGTIVEIKFEKAEAPSWFAQSLNIRSDGLIFGLDDDPSIHNIWTQRFSSKIESFTEGIKFAQAIENLSAEIRTKSLYLIDYELLGQNINGLDIIENLGIQNNAVLVTSRYEDRIIREKCEYLKVKLLPKDFAGFVALNFEN